MQDSWQREINYLRISITDRCNLRCQYCLPKDNFIFIEHKEILTYDEIKQIVLLVAIPLGVTKIRLTGGEPLVRKNASKLIEMLSCIPQIKDLSLTTNGILLEQYANQMYKSGLKRINISLDSLQEEKYKEITCGGDLKKVIKGINLALNTGFEPIKINTVLMKGINDDEIISFCKLTLDLPLHIRFIELMPFGSRRIYSDENFIPVQDAKKNIEKYFELSPVKIKGNGPAEYFEIKGARGSIGFITPISNCFCDRCNRLRLTADGKLKTCLFAIEEIDLKTPLRNGATPEELQNIAKIAIANKQKQHNNKFFNTRIMSQIGG